MMSTKEGKECQPTEIQTGIDASLNASILESNALLSSKQLQQIVDYDPNEKLLINLFNSQMTSDDGNKMLEQVFAEYEQDTNDMIGYWQQEIDHPSMR